MADALHILMASYGWTLQEVLEVTFPQIKMLFGAITRTPPMNVIAPALLKAVEASAMVPTDINIEALGGSEMMGKTISSKDKVVDFFRELLIQGQGQGKGQGGKRQKNG